MSYFHTGIRTIIGAEAFHCPVRDGKEWYHFAMVIRQNFLSSWPGFSADPKQPIYRVNQFSLLRHHLRAVLQMDFECVNLA